LLHSIVFRDGYAGYKPNVIEIPNGDGKADSLKRYAHIATKYFQTRAERLALTPFLELAHSKALEISEALDLPYAFEPRIEYGALRILDYPPGAISNEHEDFDLFTLMCYRDQPDRFVAKHVKDDASLRAYWLRGNPAPLEVLRHHNSQAHMGQLGTEIGLGPATPHQVLASETRQFSIVYFAIPDHASILPSGLTVRGWLNERMARSRTAFKDYE
jgi:isopenicillin N synthase-like dioxygenase